MKILDELWYGNISPFEQCTRGEKRLKELLKLVARNREELEALNKQMNELDMREHYVNEFIAKAKEYIEMPKLTPELLRAFIRKIEVMEKTEKYSRTCGNTIIIHYTFEYPRQCTTNPVNNEKTA